MKIYYLDRVFSKKCELHKSTIKTFIAYILYTTMNVLIMYMVSIHNQTTPINIGFCYSLMSILAIDTIFATYKMYKLLNFSKKLSDEVKSELK